MIFESMPKVLRRFVLPVSGILIALFAYVSGKFNYGFGVKINQNFGEMFLSFSASEVIFPILAIFCFGVLVRWMCITVSIATLLASVIAGASFGLTEVLKKSNESRGVESVIQSRVVDGDIAQKEYMLALDASRDAQDACKTEQDRNKADSSQGYVKRRCGEARLAALHAEKLRGDLGKIREEIDGEIKDFTPEHEAGFSFLAKIFGISVGLAEGISLSIFSVINSCLVFVGMAAVADITRGYWLRSKGAAKPSEASKGNASKGSGGGSGGGPKGGGKKPIPTKKPSNSTALTTLPRNVTPIETAKKAKPTAKKTAPVVSKSKFEKDLSRARGLIRDGRLEKTIASLCSKKAKRLGIRVGTAYAKRIIDSLKEKKTDVEGRASD